MEFRKIKTVQRPANHSVEPGLSFVNKICTVALLLFTIPLQVKSQVLPKEGAALNYRIVPIAFPYVNGIPDGVVEIASGNYYSEDSFQKNIILSVKIASGGIMAEVPAFGRKYTWRTVYKNDKSGPEKSSLHHFSTTTIPNVDTNEMRFRITDTAVQFGDHYVFLDGNKVLYDMRGHPIWYLPEFDGLKYKPGLLRDLKITGVGTITFLYGEKAYEVDFNGNILWKAPGNNPENEDSSPHYHHEFTRLSNGHYLILGTEYVHWSGADSSTTETNTHIAPVKKNEQESQNHDGMKRQFGTIIEYDENGKMVWNWRSSAYFLGTDANSTNTDKIGKSFDVHENAFFFDEKNENIYVSFRGLNEVLKVQYPSGKVLNTYGKSYTPGSPDVAPGLFCSQHSCKRSQDGFLYLYNNNTCAGPNAPSKVIIMQEPATQKDTLKKIWEYECRFENINSGKANRGASNSGGNVIEMPDHSLFVSMNSEFSKVFIVNPDKKILWSAIPEQWRPHEKKWEIIPQYRGSIINRGELERLIWRSALGK